MNQDRPDIILPPGNGRGRKQKSFVLRSAVGLYGLMLAFSLAWAFVREDLDLFHHPEPLVRYPWHAELWGGALAGVLFGLAVTWLSRVTAQRAGWARNLLVEMKAILGKMDAMDAFVLAAVSAVCEEILFRGILQSHLGLVWSSLIFGFVHLPRNRVFLLWTLEATLLGFCLGFLFLLTGTLAAPIAAHFTINFGNLLYMQKYRTGEDR
jgi:membrane protease YdiL (CAAX protease family)